jgi:hypothetical protein
MTKERVYFLANLSSLSLAGYSFGAEYCEFSETLKLEI